MVLFRSRGRLLAGCLLVLGAVLSGGAESVLATCGPFTDTASDSFCSFILEVFYLGITTGTTPTSFDPSGAVNRTQMGAFLSRTVDSVLKRGSHRAAMNFFWTPQNPDVIGTTTVGFTPFAVATDGEDLWVSSASGAGLVSRIHASDGRILETVTANGATGVLVAAGKIFIASDNSPGRLYRIDPRDVAGTLTTLASNLGNTPFGIAFDGAKIWTANGNNNMGGSISIVTPTFSIPWTVTTVTTGFSQPVAPLFDGSNIWISDSGAGTLLKVGANGSILQTVTLGGGPAMPVFDGTNIWVPNSTTSSVAVVRASTGAVLATLTATSLASPFGAAFDGQRVLVTSPNSNNVALWKAADFSFLGYFGTGINSNPVGACSDGTNFWITLAYETGPIGQLARF